MSKWRKKEYKVQEILQILFKKILRKHSSINLNRNKSNNQEKSKKKFKVLKNYQEIMQMTYQIIKFIKNKFRKK